MKRESKMSKGSTIDPAEAAHFEKLASLWWDESGPFWPLHGMNRLRSTYIRDQILQRLPDQRAVPIPLEGLRVLDIGCGGGILSEAIARLGASVHAVDMVERNIRIARGHAADQGLDIDYECCTAEKLAKRGEVYDVVLNMEVVEHVADLPLFMRSCDRMVRPGGLMFVATLNRTWASYVGAIVGAEYLLRWLPKGTHHWRKFPRPAELGALMAADGLRVVDRTGVGVNLLSHRFRLTGRMGINYILVATKP
jgi:2-polyprenyl-6-hydroxyphenyl methylase/3-demethylubiquinone-9 3-methyltransferase